MTMEVETAPASPIMKEKKKKKSKDKDRDLGQIQVCQSFVFGSLHTDENFLLFYYPIG